LPAIDATDAAGVGFGVGIADRCPDDFGAYFGHSALRLGGVDATGISCSPSRAQNFASPA
jgi:hypothetical protein